jgi:hypothetical protein
MHIMFSTTDEKQCRSLLRYLLNNLRCRALRTHCKEKRPLSLNVTAAPLKCKYPDFRVQVPPVASAPKIHMLLPSIDLFDSSDKLLDLLQKCQFICAPDSDQLNVCPPLTFPHCVFLFSICLRYVIYLSALYPLTLRQGLCAFFVSSLLFNLWIPTFRTANQDTILVFLVDTIDTVNVMHAVLFLLGSYVTIKGWLPI